MPLPVIVTPGKPASVSVPLVTDKLVVIDALSPSPIVMALAPLKLNGVSSVAATMAGAAIIGESLIGLTISDTVAVVVAPSASTSVYVKLSGPL